MNNCGGIRNNFILSLYGVFLLIFGNLSCKNTEEKSWVYLFDNERLEGWTIRGGNMLFSLDRGVLVGEAIPGQPNGFLCSEKFYRDFILEYEFKTNQKLNSGVQIRGQSRPDYQNERVHGWQVEIDPSSRSWTGGIYDEARRGWLYPLNENEPARMAYKPDDWNHIRIEAIGDTIKTWLNDVQAAWLVDDTDYVGFIAFQVHTVRNIPENRGLSVRFRNVRIISERPERFARKEIMNIRQVNIIPNSLTKWEVNERWELLFDGKTSAGWHGVCTDIFPENSWSISDGSLTVNPDSDHGSMDIITERKFLDFELKFEFKLTENSSSGLVHNLSSNKNSSDCSYEGLEFQIADDKREGLEKNQGLASLYGVMVPTNKFPSPVGQWNNGSIIKKGSMIEYWLNNLKVLDFDVDSREFRENATKSGISKDYISSMKGGNGEGYIMLQHEKSLVSFRSLKIKEL